MAGFVKIYGDQLLGSSLMDEAVETRWMFMVLAAKADENGFVRCQTTGVAARLANLTEEQAALALEALSSPDQNSTSKDEGGRRIVRVDGGWRLVNHSKYREMRTEEQVRTAQRQRRYRERHGVTRNARNAGETEVSASPSVSVSFREEGYGEKPLPPPPEQRAELAVTDTIHSMQLRLGGLLSKLAEHPNSRLMVPAWSSRVTSYDKSDGTHVKGRSDFRTVMSIERLEKSIGDAEWYLTEMDKGAVYES